MRVAAAVASRCAAAHAPIGALRRDYRFHRCIGSLVREALFAKSLGGGWHLQDRGPLAPATEVCALAPALSQGQDVASVLEVVRRSRGFDPTGYCPGVLASRVQSRLEATGLGEMSAYRRKLETEPAELEALVDALTVKVSGFFRDPLAFELLLEQVLPELLVQKAAARDPSLRIWSAGCATGEEAWSLAILIDELLRRESSPPAVTILATDIDRRALERARQARYPAGALANVRHGLVATAFEPDGEALRVTGPVAGLVTFAVHDLLDPRTTTPAESIFGSFDLVLCRNVLIYFEPAWQEFACEKLYRALAPGGHLLLGRTESLPGPWAARFRRVPGLRYLHRKPTRRTSTAGETR